MLQLLLETIATKFLFFALHLNNTGSFPPPLSAEEEHNCLAACAAGDKTARDKLIEHNLRLVVHVIKKYYANCIDQDDLISVGTIGLIKAINTFNTENVTLAKNLPAVTPVVQLVFCFRNGSKWNIPPCGSIRCKEIDEAGE